MTRIMIMIKKIVPTMTTMAIIMVKQPSPGMDKKITKICWNQTRHINMSHHCLFSRTNTPHKLYHMMYAHNGLHPSKVINVQVLM